MINIAITIIFGAPNQSLCTPVTVMLDGRIEATERFTVQLNTSDNAVFFNITETQVVISDSDGKVHQF